MFVLALRVEIAAQTRPSYRVVPALILRHRVSVVSLVVSDLSGHLYLQFIVPYDGKYLTNLQFIVPYDGKYLTNLNSELNIEFKKQRLLEIL
jgi:hypothetical protein